MLAHVLPLAGRAAAIAAAGALAALGANALRPDGLRLSSFDAPVMCGGAGDAEARAGEVDVAEAASLCGRTDVVIAGARSLWAGVMKLADPRAFAVEITNYHLLPELAPWLAVALPGAEIGIGIALLLAPRPWMRAAAAASAALLAVFTVAVAQVVARG